jgi:hypothetical protein
MQRAAPRQTVDRHTAEEFRVVGAGRPPLRFSTIFWLRFEPTGMVHPNIGSMLCIASLHERGIQFAVNQRGAFGLQLFDLSYGPLQVYVAKEFVQQTYVIIHLKFQSDELE